MARPLRKRIGPSVLVAGVGLAAFLAAYSYLSGEQGEFKVRAEPGQAALYLARPLAAQALALQQRAAELRTPPSASKMRTHALARVGNADWIEACDLVDILARDLAPLVQGGEPGTRLHSHATDLLAHRERLGAVVERFAAASMLHADPVGEEMYACLRRAAEFIRELASGIE